ncbi:MAG: tetratricopeptide repeat protein [Saprospiraceae bacterium]|nr:tetratricopeptide repeat protein [Saprospiraceae bacterium]
MKNTIISICLVALLTVSLFSCKNEKNPSVAKAGIGMVDQVPQLFDRNDNLQYGKEWETVQNIYGRERKALMDDPNAKEPWLNLAELFIQEARVTGEHPHYYPAALQCLEVLLAKPFDDKNIKEKDLKFRALSAKASVELSQHEFAKALVTGEEALKLNPFNSGIYGVLTDANVELGHYDKAVEMADKMVSIKPDLRSYSRVSYLREIHGDVQGAIDALTMAAQAGAPGADNTAWCMVTLGNLYKEYGKLAESESVFQAILEERPDYPFALAGLATVATERKNYKLAEQYLEKAKAIIPEVSFYEKLAVVYKATGREAEYKRTIDEVIEMMNDDAKHGHNMDLEFAKVYHEFFKNNELAIKFGLKEYAARPENIDVNGVLASIYEANGDLAKAKFHGAKALRTGSKKPDYLALNTR